MPILRLSCCIADSYGVTILFCQLALDWFVPKPAQFRRHALPDLANSLFYGTVALTYSVKAFFSALLGYLSWRICCGDQSTCGEY